MSEPTGFPAGLLAPGTDTPSVPPGTPITDTPPAHSLLKDGRLVAYVWPATGGSLRRAGEKGQEEKLGEVPFAEIRTFSPEHEAPLMALVGKARDLDAFLFKVGMEEYQILNGPTSPSLRVRRF